MTVRYLILILTTRCNLSCRYCYNGNETGADMTPEILGRAFALASDGSEPLHVQFTGGEPTLRPDLLAQAAEEARRLSRPVTLAVQTNGTLLTPELLALCQTQGIEVGMSLDGPPAINELTRGGSRESFEGLRLLETRGVDFNVTAVLSRANVGFIADLPLVLAGFAHARGFGLDLLVKKGRAQVEPVQVGDLAPNIRKLDERLVLINRQRTRPLVWREKELLRDRMAGHQGDFCHACRGESLAVRPDGWTYPCGQTSDSPEFLFGTQTPNATASSLIRLKLTGPHCRQCALHGRCPGECPSRLHYNRGEEAFLICELYRALNESLEAVLKKQA
ncbi:MAG: radical SAM protein [Candidatus Accumulibacter sp.]|jgi:uncharacterized protein|nr:radical SAM protein [Accumulibacter sp.]